MLSVLPLRRCFSISLVHCSRIGKTPIPFNPNQVQLLFENPYPIPSEGAEIPSKRQFDRRPPYLLKVRGPLGEIEYPLKPCVRLQITDNAKLQKPRLETSSSPSSTSSTATDPSSFTKTVLVHVDHPTLDRQKAIWGSAQSLVANMVHGVTVGWLWKLKFVGVGYRAHVANDQVHLAIGNANLIHVPIPPGISVVCPTQDTMEVSGVDKMKVAQFAATIRKHRPPEPYNQKGIFVNDETIIKKKSKKR